jgi:multidrug efflux system membrane fusion protein
LKLELQYASDATVIAHDAKPIRNEERRMSRSSVLIAGALALGTAGWVASGMLGAENGASVAPVRAEPTLPLVEVADLRARPVERVITAQGDVAAFRRAAAKTQSAGRVSEILVNRGDSVEEGQPLLRLTLEGLDSRLREATAILERRQSDYDSAESLQRSGYSTAAALRELETLLRTAREEVRRLEEEIADTTIRAPFAGQVDAVSVETGEYVESATDVVTVIDNVPLRTTVRINQQDRAKVETGRTVEVAYATGQVETGAVCFIAAAADPATRTFEVEIRTPNRDGAIPSGISAEVRIPVDAVEAQFVSPAILSLGTDGTLGLKTVDADGVVAFHAVELVRADAEGLWVSGLPSEAEVITLGQGFVQAGDKVRTATAQSPLTPHATRTPAPAAALPGDLCDRAPALRESAIGLGRTAPVAETAL